MTRRTPKRSSEDRTPTGSDPYEVGYGKPPKASQFKPGHSGNPSGRRKRPQSVAEQLEDILKRKIEITHGGKVKRVSLQEVMLTTLVNKAAKGDLAAFRAVMDLKASHAGSTGETIDLGLLSTEGQSIIEAFVSDLAESDNSDGSESEQKDGQDD